MTIPGIKNLRLLWLNRHNKGVLNYHLWIIAFIILILTLLYYVNLSMFDHPGLRQQWFWNWIVIEFNYGLNGLLFCIPFIYAAIIFGWRGILVTWFASMVLNLPRLYFLSFNVTVFITNLFILLIPLLIVLIFDLLRNWKKSIRKDEMEREKERQVYIGMVLKAQDDERKRISREIHDDTTQRLWIVSNQIQNLINTQTSGIEPDSITVLAGIRTQIIHISDDAKRLSLALRPGILDNLGLIPALRWLLNQMNENEKIETDIRIEGIPRQFSSDVSMHLYRITQEALNNVRQHSEATRVTVKINFEPHTVKLDISDDGKGITADISKLPIQNKLGLLGIQERVRLLNGKLKISPNPLNGTTLSVEFEDHDDSLSESSIVSPV